MYIKQVNICGFRSYRDLISVDPFSPHHNVVIGRNGTGKSNFFDAIRFVLLTSRFANLRLEDRQALLHEGSGKHVMSAYVEIIFDNSDGRLPVDTETVVLRRTIGVKKDEFFLNRKHLPKNDVIHLLESAGFSRSNPYYIVQQGKVNALALMKDKDRLELLKEVAGTRVYEDRRTESLTIMNETNSRRDKIQEVIMYIESRLSELENEKEELTAYQSLDKEKRAVEYTLYQKELTDIEKELNALESTREKKSLECTQAQDELLAVHGNKTTVEASISEEEETVKNLNLLKKSNDKEKKVLMQVRMALEMEVKEIEDQVTCDGESKESKKLELENVSIRIQNVTTELEEDLLPKRQEAKEQYEQEANGLKNIILEMESLQEKQSRKSQFATQSLRDKYLKKEGKAISLLAKSQRKDVCQLQEDLVTLRATQEERKEDLSDIEASRVSHRATLDALNVNITERKTLRNALSEERKEAWRSEQELKTSYDRITTRLSRHEDVLYSTMSPEVRRGLTAIKTLSVTGQVFGPIIELITLKEEHFDVVVDEAAGNALFHVVVDTDETAAQLMAQLQAGSLGRVTFLPLNRLHEPNGTRAPRNEDVVPLMDQLDYSPEIQKAVWSVFGKKLLCKDLDTCAKYAKSSNMDALTIQGDVVQRRGGLSGGYKDPNKSRMKSMGQVLLARNEMENSKNELEKSTTQAATLDTSVSRVLGELQKLETDHKRSLELLKQAQVQLRSLQREVEKSENHVTAKNTLLDAALAEETDLARKGAAIGEELNTTMEDSLTVSESSRLRQLTVDVSSTTSQVATRKAEMDALTSQVKATESLLGQNLQKRSTELKRSIEADDDEGRVPLLESKRLDWEQSKAEVATNVATNVAQSEALRTATSKLVELRTEMEEMLSREREATECLVAESSKAEQILNARSRLLAKREDAMQALREVGTLPDVSNLSKKSVSALKKQLHKAQEKLQGYQHVNKKALDQYVSFSEQRAELLSRQRELESGQTSIQELIDVLDRRKDEAILRTFKGVSHHFTEVFSELVPTGAGRMLIVKSSDPDTEDVDSMETFTGVQIKVNFRGEGESYLMSQLSGGQKALVALAFIFAIQRCDPAPFYLFDEIDQALDSSHRAAVAALIHRQAHAERDPAQFITSTFRPEMVKVADACYGVGHQNKVSDVHKMANEEALEFIADIMASEEGVAP